MKFVAKLIVPVFVLCAAFGCKPDSGRTNTDGTPQLSDYAEKRIGVIRGSVFVSQMKNKFPKAQLLEYDTLGELLTALKSYQIDAFPTNESVVRYSLKSDSTLTSVSQPLFRDNIGFGFARSRSDLLAQFNDFLQELRDSGELTAILCGWKDDEKTMPTPKLGGDGSGGTIRFATTGTYPPESFMREDEYAGCDIDIVYRFAAKHNYKVSVIKRTFPGMLESLRNGQADLAGSSWSITKERKKIIDFSDSYFFNDYYLIIRKL